jgi:trehalose 6-phosphate phosphatase
MSYELHPPIEADKGTTVIELAGALRAVCYIGDDLGDLAAFDGLDELASRGVDAVRVAVRSAELSPLIVERADVLLDGPAAVVALLEQLRVSGDAR